MTICFCKISFVFLRAQLLVFACLYFSVTSLSFADLYITDDYLKGLESEVESVEQPSTNNTATDNKTTAADLKKAAQSRFNFENLLRTKHQASFVIYTKLSTSNRILIFDQFKSSKNLSQTKQMIIEKFESR